MTVFRVMTIEAFSGSDAAYRAECEVRRVTYSLGARARRILNSGYPCIHSAGGGSFSVLVEVLGLGEQRIRDIVSDLTDHQRRSLLRTKDKFSPRPWICGRTVAWKTMAILRDRHELVEEDFGLWRRTAMGIQVARAIQDASDS